MISNQCLVEQAACLLIHSPPQDESVRLADKIAVLHVYQTLDSVQSSTALTHARAATISSRFL